MPHSPGFIKIVQDAKRTVQEISPEQLKNKLSSGTQNFYLIDVREKEEWDRGHIEGAWHLSKGIIERDIENKIPDLDAALILYCGGGSRSALAAKNLLSMGYRNVLSLASGYSGWLECHR